MKIKSLLLGSAAAMVAVTSANAADVFIPEPEVVEYVRVCDAAGDGYFYIPGSETCLQITGEVIYKMHFDNDAVPSQQGWEKEYEIGLDFNTWRETELGDLTTSIQLGASDSTDIDVGGNDSNGLNDANVQVQEAFITLAGLTIGYTDSRYASGFGASDFDGGEPDTGIVAYMFEFDAGEVHFSLEEVSDSTWVPAVVGAAEIGFDPVTLNVAGVYDDSHNFFGGVGIVEFSNGPITIDAGVQYSSDSDPDGAFTTLSLYSTSYEWVFGVGVDFDVNDSLTIFGGVDYGMNFIPAVSTAANDITTTDNFLVEVGGTYTIVDGFDVTVQADFTDVGGTFDFEDAEIEFKRAF